jgi:hypothetical protein
MSIKQSLSSQKGDTVVEVMIAFAVFAAILVSSMAIMNLGIGKSMRSLEITQVRQQMDAQAEMIRFIHDEYVAAYEKNRPEPSNPPASYWLELRSLGISPDAIAAFSNFKNGCPVNTDNISEPFFIGGDLGSGDLEIFKKSSIVMSPPSGATLPPHSQIDYQNGQAYGMWIQSVPGSSESGGITTKYIDFHIRACWQSSGGAEPVTLGTIVRLYEPSI